MRAVYVFRQRMGAAFHDLRQRDLHPFVSGIEPWGVRPFFRDKPGVPEARGLDKFLPEAF